MGTFRMSANQQNVITVRRQQKVEDIELSNLKTTEESNSMHWPTSLDAIVEIESKCLKKYILAQTFKKPSDSINRGFKTYPREFLHWEP